jgi:hypothetical protein
MLEYWPYAAYKKTVLYLKKKQASQLITINSLEQ